MTQPLTIALVGHDHPHLGAWAELLENMPEYDAVAFCDPISRVQDQPQPASPLQDKPIYTNIGELIAGETFQAALVCLPNKDAVHFAMLLADAGKHLLVEKPVARNAPEMRELIDATQAAKVKLTSGYLQRLNPPLRAAASIVRQGILGRILSVETSMITTNLDIRNPNHYIFDRDASGGGILSWLGCHQLDLIRYVSGEEILSVSAVTSGAVSGATDVEVAATVSMRLSNGGIGSLHTGYLVAADPHSFLGIRGDKGWIRWNSGGPLEMWSSDTSWKSAPKRTWSYEIATGPGYCGPIGTEFMLTFKESIDRELPGTVNPADALRVLEVIDACYKSNKTGQRVDL